MQFQSLGQEDTLKKEWQPTAVFLPGKSYGQRSLAGYGPWGRKESDTAERLTGHLTDEEVLFRMHKQLPESNERTRETGNLESYTNGQRRRKHRRPTVSERLRHTGTVGPGIFVDRDQTHVPCIGRQILSYFATKGSEVAQSCLTLCNPVDCSLPGFSNHGIFQARVLEWVAISFSRGSSRPWD